MQAPAKRLNWYLVPTAIVLLCGWLAIAGVAIAEESPTEVDTNEDERSLESADGGPEKPSEAEPGDSGDADAHPDEELAEAPEVPAAEPEGYLGPASGVEEIVVTGAKTPGEIVEGTASTTAFDASELHSLGVDNLADISDYTPNLEIVTAGTTSPTFFLRGVGLNDFSPIATGAISVYQNDVPRGAPAILLGRLFDVQNVVVLRGPQGTGPYRNASAGAIKIYSAQPTGDFDGYLRASYGNYDYLDFEGALDVPVVDQVLAVRTAFGVTRRDGWMKNRCGSLPPRELRDKRTGTQSTNAPPHSQCGELVDLQGLGPDDPLVERNPDRAPSDVPAGLPDEVNAISNWAVRSIARFTPDVGLDTEWNLNVHYSRVRDDSHVGQEIGIQEAQPDPETGDPTVYPGSGPQNSAPGRAYADVDITDRLAELREREFARCGATCLPPTPNPERRPARRAANLRARTQLAEEMNDLDADPFAGAVDHVGETTNENFGVGLVGDILFDAMELKSITGFERWDRRVDTDLDFTPDTDFHLDVADEGYQFSQELRLFGDLEGASLLHWEIGGWFLADEVAVFATTDNNSSVPGVDLIRDYTQNVWSAAAYFDAEWDITEVWGIDFGARWNYERKDMDYELGPSQVQLFANESVSWSVPTGRVRFRYQPTEDVKFYLMYSRGWKAGSYNATSNPVQGVTFAEPEQIDAFEFGWDFTAFDGRWSLTGALFYYDYFNYQIFTAENTLSPAPEFVTINANDAEVYGAEIETFMEPFDGSILRVNFGWLESQFIDFNQRQLRGVLVDGQTLFFEKIINNTGNRLLNSPRFTVAILASQAVELGRFGSITARYNGAWTDDVFFDPSEGGGVRNEAGQQVLSDFAIGEEAYWLHGLSLDYVPADSRFTVTGWVRNLTNEGYRTFAADLNTFLGTTIHFIGEPRTYGVTVRFDF
jgi:outer membrane receptor protein involved in Fe transport